MYMRVSANLRVSICLHACIHICVCLLAHVPWHTRGDERTTCGSLFCLSTTWEALHPLRHTPTPSPTEIRLMERIHSSGENGSLQPTLPGHSTLWKNACISGGCHLRQVTVPHGHPTSFLNPVSSSAVTISNFFYPCPFSHLRDYDSRQQTKPASCRRLASRTISFLASRSLLIFLKKFF